VLQSPRRPRRALIAAAVFAVTTVALAACSSSSSSSQSASSSTSTSTSTSGSVVKVAVVNSQSGLLAAYGLSEVDGVKAAISYVNAHGGVAGAKIQAQYFDDQSSATVAAQLAQQIVSNSSYVACVGCYASTLTASSALPVFEQANFPILVGTDAIGTNPNWAYSSVPSYPDQGQMVVNGLAKLGLKKPGVIYGLDVYGEGNLHQLTVDSGLSIVKSYGSQESATTFAPELTQMAADHADSYVDLLTGTALASMVTDWASQGKPGTLVTGIAGANPSALKASGSAANGIYAASYFNGSVPQNQQQTDLVTTYKAMFNTLPPLLASSSWDEVLLFAQAAKSGLGHSAIKSGLAGITSFAGASGSFNFSNNQHDGWSGGGMLLKFDAATGTYTTVK